MRGVASDAKIYESYAKYDETKKRYETWDESCERVFHMHEKKFRNMLTPKLMMLMDEALSAYKSKLVLGAQRALQFGGDSLLKHEAKMYNCSASYIDRAEVFGESMYLLLCGAGVGVSVQKHHVDKLPEVISRDGEEVTFVIPDSIEGWSEAIDVLMSSYFHDESKYSKYRGKKVSFDYSRIRPKGSPINGGFKAPGPSPLMKCIDAVEKLLNGVSGRKMKPIEAYDVLMHIADAVISGGVRRAATIAIFSPDDEEMLSAKTGNWYIDNPQRARSNNSAMLVRGETSKQDLDNIVRYIRQFGEPGFIFSESAEFVYNPCVEIGMYPVDISGATGFQMCNLTEINGGKCSTPDVFYQACRAAAIIGTLQAAYTDFKYLSNATKRIVDREALIGVSITGWMNNPEVLFNEEVMRNGAEIVKMTNREVAELIGINPAARTTCVKPSGNASVILQTANGIHGEHSKRYFRHIQMSKDTEVAKIIAKYYPEMVEDSVWSKNNLDYAIAFPFLSTDNSIFKKDLLGSKQLEYVKKAQENWVEHGTNYELCVDGRTRHNVSNTITVDDWDEVMDYVYENKHTFAGVSFIPLTGDRDYAQAPNAEVLTEDELMLKWGQELVDDGSALLPELSDLWEAEYTDNITKTKVAMFAERWDMELSRAFVLLKDIHYLDKWNRIQASIQGTHIDWVAELGTTESYIDIDTMGAQACSGAIGCEI